MTASLIRSTINPNLTRFAWWPLSHRFPPPVVVLCSGIWQEGTRLNNALDRWSLFILTCISPNYPLGAFRTCEIATILQFTRSSLGTQYSTLLHLKLMHLWSDWVMGRRRGGIGHSIESTHRHHHRILEIKGDQGKGKRWSEVMDKTQMFPISVFL